MTQQQMITGNSWEEEYGLDSIEALDFHTLYYGYRNEDSLLGRNGITLRNYIGHIGLTGNELLYYPELAKRMHALAEYPVLKRTYVINDKVCGIAFIEYFYKRVKEAYASFQSELMEASKTVNNLIYLYGTERKIPLVESGEKAPRYQTFSYLVINGIKWNLNRWKGSELYNKHTYVDLYRLLDVPEYFRELEVTEAVLGTPFVAVRRAQSYKHKGRVTWYSLDTRQPLSKAEVKKIT